MKYSMGAFSNVHIFPMSKRPARAGSVAVVVTCATDGETGRVMNIGRAKNARNHRCSLARAICCEIISILFRQTDGLTHTYRVRFERGGGMGVHWRSPVGSHGIDASDRCPKLNP